MRVSTVLFVVISIGVLVQTPVLSATNNPFADAPPDLVQLVNNTVICRFKDHVLSENVPAFTSQIVQSEGGEVRHTYTTAIKGFSAYMSVTAAQALQRNNPNIEYCEPNALVKAGGHPVSAGKGQGKGNPGSELPSPQIVPEGVTRVGGPIDGTGLNVWVIDSGVDLDNPDLNIDASRGADVVKTKGKSTLDDVYGHGTHVSGTIAAIDNDIGVVGVAAGATIIPVRVLKASDYGTVDDAIAGIDFVAAHARPGEVANMSAWWWKHHRALHEAAYNLANIIPFVVISGNDGADLNEMPAEPAHVEHPNLYTVSAVDHEDQFADFSNWGYAYDHTNCDQDYPDDPFPCATVDYAAPGKDVISLHPTEGLATWWGTSMAAPHVTAIILLKVNGRPNYGGLPPNSDGVAIGDPDSYPDPIIHY
ncbi:MAG: S8 family serine peptidase [Gammaproteobacteria bacterium]|jgi:subtilisin family serine protease